METLKEAVRQRLCAAAEEIFGLFERTMVEFEAEIMRQLKPDMGASGPAFFLLPPQTSGVSGSASEHQEWRSHVKMEEGRVWTNQEEAGVCDVTAVAVKNESAGDEERPESSQRHLQNRRDDGIGAPPSGSTAVLQLQDSDSLSGDDESDEGGEFHPCGECGQQFAQLLDLNAHMKIHADENAFTCGVCGEKFAQKAQLIQHMSGHTGEAVFNCGVCQKPFTLLYQLRKHERLCYSGDAVRLHIQELAEATPPGEGRGKKKQVPCPVCGEVFGSNDSLRRHFRCHTGEKPFGCPICGRHFRDRGNMGKHMVLHTGEKRFSCDACGQRFTWKVQLKKHKCDGGGGGSSGQ